MVQISTPLGWPLTGEWACPPREALFVKLLWPLVSLPPTKVEVNAFARVCMSVSKISLYSKTRASIWMKCCMSTDVGTRTNGSTFEFVRMPELDCFLRYRVSAATRNFTLRKSDVYVLPLQRGVVLTWFHWASEPSKQLCRRYMCSTECPSSFIYFWGVIVQPCIIRRLIA